MNLRGRLLLGVLLTAMPVALVTTAWQSRRELDRVGELVRERANTRFELVGREACEADPSSFPDVPPSASEDDWLFGDAQPPSFADRSATGPGGVRYFVYDRFLAPARLDAPPLAPRVADAVRHGEDAIAWLVPDRHPGAPRRGRLERVLVRAPWTSSVCAFVLVERPRMAPPGLLRGLLVPALVTLAVVLAVLVVAGPVVARIRALTAAVRDGRAGAPSSPSPAADEIGELAQAFVDRERTIARQLAELGAREAALREHLAATSHDVLLPITVLQGHLVAMDEAIASGRPVPPELLRDALQETDYVGSLVRDLNAEARLRAGLPEVRTRLDLSVLVERVTARSRTIAAKSGIDVQCATPDGAVCIDGDPTLVEQMFSNLVHNAVRHGRDGGHVAVVLRAHDGGFSVEVLDDGPGVSIEDLARLSERGFRTDEARTRRPEGMGLGLHIAREVAAAHGLTLAFRANEPTGLAVRVEGPLSEAPGRC